MSIFEGIQRHWANWGGVNLQSRISAGCDTKIFVGATSIRVLFHSGFKYCVGSLPIHNHWVKSSRGRKNIPESNYAAAGPAVQGAEKRFLNLILGRPVGPAKGQNKNIPDFNYGAAGPAGQGAEKRFLNLILGRPDGPAKGQKKDS